jgi:hypothetical protein
MLYLHIKHKIRRRRGKKNGKAIPVTGHGGS